MTKDQEIETLKLDPVWVFPRAEGGGPVPETNVDTALSQAY